MEGALDTRGGAWVSTHNRHVIAMQSMQCGKFLWGFSHRDVFLSLA